MTKLDINHNELTYLNRVHKKFIKTKIEIIKFGIFKVYGDLIFKIGIEDIKSKKRKKKNLKNYTFVLKNKEKLNIKYLDMFYNLFAYDLSIRESIENNTFDFDNLPEKKTVLFLKETSLSYNVKKVNNGDKKRIKNLKIWRDDYSNLKECELIEFLEKKELSYIDKEINNIKTSDKTKNKLKRSIYRWCIRGLSVEKAVEKEMFNYELSQKMIQKNIRKNYYKKRQCT